MNLPNALTLFRIALAPVFFTILISPTLSYPFFKYSSTAVFIFAALTDVFDGLLARTRGQETKLGEFLDPLADKLLIAAGVLGILLTPQIVFKPPVWILGLILFREIAFMIACFIFLFFFRPLPVQPNFLGKCTLFAQMILIVFCILHLNNALVVAYITAFLTLASGIFYSVRELIRYSKET